MATRVRQLTPEMLRAVQQETNEHAAALAKKRREAFDSNAEVQRHRQMTAEEKARNAIDLSTKSLKESMSFMQGREVTETEARRKATELAYRSDREAKR